MRMRFVFVLGLVTAACGPPALSVGPTVPTFVQVGSGQREVRTFTDLDDVRDVTTSGERVLVATDLGLLIHPANGAAPPERLTTEQGLPSNDVRVVEVTPEGPAVIATAAGLATIDGTTVTPMTTAPPVGEVTDLHVDGAGVLWACGEEGVARLGQEGWERFGEPVACTTIAQAPEGALWIGTTQALLYVEGDVIREHGQSLLPEAYVRDVVPLGEGKAMALLLGPSHAQLGYFDGHRWYGYTIADFEPAAVGIAALGSTVVLITKERAYEIEPADTAQTPGLALTPLSRSEPRRVVSYGARITAAEDVASTMSTADDPRRDVRRPPLSFAEVPVTLPSLEAPGFVVRDSTLATGENVYLVRREPESLFVAARNLGVVAIDPAGAAVALRSRDFVREQDLQLAATAADNVWTIGTHNDPARWQDDGLFRVEVPEGLIPQAIASGPRGVYVASLVEEAATPVEPVAEPDAPDEEGGAAPAAPEDAAAPPDAAPAGSSRIVRIHRVGEDGWTQVAERAITTASALVATPFLGVTNDEEFWLGLRVVHETSEGTRMRGVAVFRPDGDAVVYHHREADPARDGEGALRMPDEVTGVDLSQPGYAWLPGLAGAIRVGNSQAVAFGEARGVRGEVVSDLAVGDNERVWLAAAEGVGYREGSAFEFRLPRVVQEMRPTALALDSVGRVWGAGPNGVVYYDGTNWHPLTVQDGLPTNELVDVEVDPHDRVWLLAGDRVLLFGAPVAPAAAGPGA